MFRDRTSVSGHVMLQKGTYGFTILLKYYFKMWQKRLISEHRFGFFQEVALSKGYILLKGVKRI